MNPGGAGLIIYQLSQGVIKLDFVVQEIKTTVVKIISVPVRDINFCNKNNFRVYGLYLWNYPMPKIHAYHLGHIAPEAIHFLASPIHQNVAHLIPCIRNGFEV